MVAKDLFCGLSFQRIAGPPSPPPPPPPATLPPDLFIPVQTDTVSDRNEPRLLGPQTDRVPTSDGVDSGRINTSLLIRPLVRLANIESPVEHGDVVIDDEVIGSMTRTRGVTATRPVGYINPTSNTVFSSSTPSIQGNKALQQRVATIVENPLDNVSPNHGNDVSATVESLRGAKTALSKPADVVKSSLRASGIGNNKDGDKIEKPGYFSSLFGFK